MSDWPIALAIILFLLSIPVMAIVALVKASRLSKEQREFSNLTDARLQTIEEKLNHLQERLSENPPGFTAAEEVLDDRITEKIESKTTEEIKRDTSSETENPDNSDGISGNSEASNDDPESSTAQPWLAARNKNDRNSPEDKTSNDLESRVGAKWSVLLGGATFALGLVFLAKHSIEAGLLGPGMRTFLGFVFSALALAVGEWLRRSDKSFQLPVYSSADVPGILTGAGAIGAFATLYGAHALYGFVGPGLAFVGLTIIGIVCMLGSALHGPKLAAIGLLGAYATPLLVSSSEPNPLALALHVLIVTASVIALAHIREWRWLAIAGFIASCAWAILAAITSSPMTGLAGVFLLVGLGIIFSALFFLRESPQIRDRKTEKSAMLAYSLLAFAFIFNLAINADLPDTLTSLALSLIFVSIASLRTSLAPVALIAAVVALFTVGAADLVPIVAEGILQTSDFQNRLVPPDTAGFIQNACILSIPVAVVGLWGARRAAINAPRASGWLASSVSTLGFFAILIVYLRIAPFETKPIVGAAAIGIAALLTMATAAFIRLIPDDTKAPAPAALAVGAVSTACLAISISLDTGWMPLAFALAAFGITLIYHRRPVASLPWLALAAGGIAGITTYANMPLEMPIVSNTIIFNSLILLLLVPAVALLAGGEVLLRSKEEPNSLTYIGLTSGGLALLALFVGLEITHFINGGDLTSVKNSLAEMAGYTLAALGFAAGLQKLGERSHRSFFDKASQLAGILSVIIAAFGLLFAYNPGLTNQSVGEGKLFNLLLPGYLLTGLAAVGVTFLSRPRRPRWYTLMYAALSGLLLFTYFSLTLRNAFQGEKVGIWRTTTDLEFWLYSPMWLVLGAVLLAIGLRYRSLPIRMASGLLISLTVVKVFLLDMSELTGILRAFSFIGLGLSLIVIGRFYQRILTKQRAKDLSDQEENNEPRD